MKKFKPMKVRNGSIKLPEEFLDRLLINDGDFLLIAEEDGKFYIRKTRETSFDDESETSQDETPKTFDEIMREAQKQFASGEALPEDIMKSIQDTLQDPEMMKKIQDMAMGLFKGFGVPPRADPQSEDHPPKKEKTEKKSSDKKDDEDDDDSNGFKIDIE